MEIEDFLSGIATAVFLLVVGVVSTLATKRPRDSNLQVRIFILSYCIRFIIGCLLYTTGLNATVIGLGDDGGSHVGKLLMEYWDRDLASPVELPGAVFESLFKGINGGYGVFVGVYYYVTRLSGQVSAVALSAFFGAMTSVVVIRTTRLLYSDDVATRSGWWVCFFPSMILWSSIPVKEPLVILLETLAVYNCLQLRTYKQSIRNITSCAACLGALLTLRFYIAYILGGVILVSMVVPNLGRKPFSAASAAAIAAAFLIPLYLLAGNLTSHFEFIESHANLEYAESFRTAVSTGDGSGSGLNLDYELGTSHGFVMQLSVGGLCLLLAPFPWQLARGSLRSLLTTPEMIVWWFLFPQVLKGLVHSVRFRLWDFFPVLLFLLSMGFIYSLMCGNVGIIYRQRAQLLPYLIPMGCQGLELRRLRRLSRSGWVPYPQWPGVPPAEGRSGSESAR